MIIALSIVVLLGVILVGGVALDERRMWRDEPERYKVVEVRMRDARFQGSHRRSSVYVPHHARIRQGMHTRVVHTVA